MATASTEGDFCSWYRGKDVVDKYCSQTPNCEALIFRVLRLYCTGRPDLVHDVFNDALSAFSEEFSAEQKSWSWILDSKYGNIEEVLAAVANARDYYERHQGESATRNALVNFTEKIHHYSGVMDVMVQHHPEYASLAWGAMKVLFVGVVNHQNVVTRLASGLNRIADLLPRAELLLQLYPTSQGRQVIVAIYTHILRFLLQALDWYRDGKLKHIFHSITRPAEIKYDGLLKEIASLSGSMTEIALASSHAEQRDMHIRQKDMFTEQLRMRTELQQSTRLQNQLQIGVDQLKELVLQMKESMASEQVINASARIELRQKLSQIQLVQFLDLIKTDVLADPIKSFQSALFLHRRSHKRFSRKTPAVWLNAKVEKWNSSRESSLIIVKGTWQLRSHVQSFCTESIASLRDSNVPVFWALNTVVAQDGTNAGGQVSTIELLKYLITQAVSINKTIQNDAALTPWFSSYSSAKTEEDWMDLLMWVLHGIPKVYIVLDMEVLSRSLSSLTENFWPSAFLKGFSELSARNIRTVVKVVLVSYGSAIFYRHRDSQLQELVVPVTNARQSRASARGTFSRGGVYTRGKTLGVSRRRGFDGRLA